MKMCVGNIFNCNALQVQCSLLWWLVKHECPSGVGALLLRSCLWPVLLLANPALCMAIVKFPESVKGLNSHTFRQANCREQIWCPELSVALCCAERKERLFMLIIEGILYMGDYFYKRLPVQQWIKDFLPKTSFWRDEFYFIWMSLNRT